MHRTLTVVGRVKRGAEKGHDEPPDYGSTFKSGRGAIAATPRQGRPGRAIKARAEHFGKRLAADVGQLAETVGKALNCGHRSASCLFAVEAGVRLSTPCDAASDPASENIVFREAGNA